MERAVLLSDIEFLDGVHESDWGRIEEDSFLVNMPTPLNENQQKYLKQLQYNHERLGNTHDALFFGLVDYEKRWNFNDKNFIQVLAAFAEWGMKEVAE